VPPVANRSAPNSIELITAGWVEPAFIATTKSPLITVPLELEEELLIPDEEFELLDLPELVDVLEELEEELLEDAALPVQPIREKLQISMRPQKIIFPVCLCGLNPVNGLVGNNCLREESVGMVRTFIFIRVIMENGVNLLRLMR
jgi:hypothetical protein